jgi:hypothetical protein
MMILSQNIFKVDTDSSIHLKFYASTQISNSRFSLDLGTGFKHVHSQENKLNFQCSVLCTLETGDKEAVNSSKILKN